MARKILSPHYFGASSASYTTAIPAERIVSGMPPRFRNTESSWPYNLSMPSKPHFVREQIVAKGGDGVYMPTKFIDAEAVSALRVTSSNINRWKVSLDNLNEFGDFTPQVDDVYGFKGWLDAGTKYGPNCFEYVKPQQKTNEPSAIISFGDRLAQFDIRDTAVPKYVSEFYVARINNDAGKEISKFGNEVQRLTGYDGTKIAKALAEQAIESGQIVEPIGYIGRGGLPKGAAYGVTRTRNGKVILLVADNLYEEIAKVARSWGIDANSYLETILAEEQEHINRKSFDMGFDSVDDWIAEEKATKYSVYRKFSELAEGASGGNPRDPKYEKERARLNKQAQIKWLDWATTRERYLELYQSNRSLLKSMLESDAREKGLKGGAVEEYVEGRLYQIADEAEGKSPAMSRLERIANDAKESPREEPRETSKADSARSD